MSTNAHSKGLSRDTVETSRAARTKYRERVKSDAIQKKKAALEAAGKERSNHDSLRDKLKDLHRRYDNGKRPELKSEYQKATEDFTSSKKKLEELQAVVKKAQSEADTEMGDADAEEEVQKSLFVEDQSSKTGENVLESVEEHTSLLSPDNTNVTSQNGNIRSKTPDPDRGADFGRWTPADEDENNLFTPGHAREAAGLETDGKIVAWATRGNSKPVIVAYGPQNARKYMRSTAYRESDFIDKDTKQFGPKHRFGDNKETGIREPHEFKGIIGVAYNCPVEELAPKAPRAKGDPPNPRKPGVDIWVKWEINGEVKRCWEVRSSIKHLFRSFCDLYIYQAAVHYEQQYNAWKDGERPAEDRSPTPAVTRLQSASPGLGANIKKENQTVPAPAIQITNTALSPIKQYREEWCDLQDVDPKKMTAEDGLNFKLAWDMVQLKLKA
ncbi:hypothetical protein VE04_00385 [Pseudogymnoascus sp. 24MN13]|nr:hypothetical protein VE04_00385 [Pseudogymnoascus sp. 24MN13]